MISVIVLVLAVTASVKTQTPACVEYTSDTLPDPSLSSLSTDFTVDIETVNVETKRVTNMMMYYSQSQNMIRLTTFEANRKSDLYFMFADNEILAYDYTIGRGTCQVLYNLNSNPETFIVGGSKNGKVEVPLGVLHFTGQSGFGDHQIRTVKTGTGSSRAMEVMTFTSCQKWNIGANTATLNVTHSFSTKAWRRPVSGTIPVTIEIQGNAVLHGIPTTIHHYYHYFNYKTSVNPEVFETPSGIVCQGRLVDMPFPNLPTYIKFSGETIDHNDGIVRYIEEVFDVDDNLIVMKMQGIEDVGSSGGINHYTYIRDYMTGLSYKLNNQLQTCTSLNITEDIALPFDFVTSTGKIQQLSPDQFFYHANDKFDYLGKRNVRGMSADVWVTMTTMLNKPLEEVIVEWYFAPPNVRSWNEGSPYYKQGNYRIPVRFRSWKGKDTYSLDLNIFHVDYTKLMYGSINIRSCYPNTQSNYFQLVLAGGRELVVSTNIEEFKWRAVHDLANTAGIRWIRIADLKVYYEQNDAIIEFEMLDAPKYAVDIDTPLVAPLTLQQAAKNLLDAAASGTLSLKVYDPFTNSISKNLPVTSAQNTGTNNDPGVNIDNGFSAGALAGLGVAMAIVGGAGGGVGAYFLMR